MRKAITALGWSCAALLAWLPAQLQAQGPYVRPPTSPYDRPVVSPYLNLLRAGSNPAINYYDLVRPQEEFRTSIRSLQQQVDQAQTSRAAPESATALPVTGHPTRFFNYQTYFFTQGGTGPGGTRPGNGIPPTPGVIPARPGQPAPAPRATR
jgi:hypothetical protein